MILTRIKSHFLSDKAFPGRVSAAKRLPVFLLTTPTSTAVLAHSAFPGSPPRCETELGLETEAASLWVQEVTAVGQHEGEQKQTLACATDAKFKFHIQLQASV